MARYYLSAMDVLYRLSIWVAGIALIIMVAAIPIGIFCPFIFKTTAYLGQNPSLFYVW